MIRQFAVGKNPTPILDQVPQGSTIINISDTYTLWVSGNTGVAENNGFPLRPLASMEKPQTGPLYAIVESAAPVGTVVVMLVGDDLSGYSDPVALATAVALELFNSGITVVAHDELIYSGIINDGNPSVTKDISRFSSLNIITSGNIVGFAQETSGGDIVDLETFGGTLQYPAIWRASGTVLNIAQLNGGFVSPVTVWGSTRNAIVRLDARQNVSLLTNSAVVVVAVGVNNIGTIDIQTGRCLVTFNCTAGVTTGYFRMVDIKGNTMAVCQTSDMPAGVSFAKVKCVELILPPQVTWQYVCTGAVGGSVSIQIAQGVQ